MNMRFRVLSLAGSAVLGTACFAAGLVADRIQLFAPPSLFMALAFPLLGITLSSVLILYKGQKYDH
jgi:hypothetical protein